MDAGCEKALQRLRQAEWEEGASRGELEDARRHLAECGFCRAWMRRDEVLVGRLRDLRFSASRRCPPSVRAAIAAGIDAELDSDSAVPSAAGFLDRLARRRRSWPPWAEGLIAASAAALLIAGGLTLSQQLDSNLSNETILADFHRSALPELAHADLSDEELRTFYEAQFAGREPQLVLDAPVKKVAVCDLDGRKGAMIEYDWNGRRLVYYQVPRKGKDGGMVEGLRMSREDGLAVARWADSAYDYVLVGAAPVETLEALARTSRS